MLDIILCCLLLIAETTLSFFSERGNRHLSGEDRAALKVCFSRFSEKLHSKLHDGVVRKLRCAANSSLNVKLPDLELPSVDSFFTVEEPKNHTNVHPLDCVEFQFSQKDRTEVAEAIIIELEMMDEYFWSEEISDSFQNASACTTTSVSDVQAGMDFGNEYLIRRDKFRYFYRNVKGSYKMI